MMADHDADPKSKSILDLDFDADNLKPYQEDKQQGSMPAPTDEVKKEATFHARPSGRHGVSITTDHVRLT